MFQSENLSLFLIDLSQSFYLLHWIKNSFQFIQSSSFPQYVKKEKLIFEN